MAKIENSNQIKKSLSDYIHLYIGCQVYDSYNDKIGKLVSVNITDRSVTVLHRSQWDLANFEIKPILRPLSDMNRTDASKMRFAYPMPNDYSYSNEVWSPDQLKYALDHFYDVFGLIDDGLAISSLDVKGGSDE